MRRIFFDVTDSTSVQARLLAAAHPGEALLVTAGKQTAGRGRLGRSWASPRGGAWMTLVWPAGSGAGGYAEAALALAEAVRRAVCAVAPELESRVTVKWPNDVLVDGRKVAGILCEYVPGIVTTAATDARGTLLVGVGVNVDFDLALLGEELRERATTLRDAVGCAVDVEAVIENVARELVSGLEAFEADSRARAALTGR